MIIKISSYVVLFAALAASLLATSKPVTVPLTISPDGLLMVPATVAGTAVNVIFDTGAGLDVLAPSLIEKVHGKPAGQFTGFRMTGERLDIQLFLISEVTIGPVKKQDDLVGSFDLLDKMHIDGIVSANNFRQQPFTLDFVGHEFVFETPRSMAQRKAAGKEVALRLDDQRGISLDLFAQFLFGAQPGQCEIDTGSPNATLSMRYLTLLGIDKDSKDVHKQESTTIVGNKEVRYNTRLPQITLAGAHPVALENPDVAFSDIIYDCVIGTDFWAGKAVTIDIPDRKVFVAVPTRTR